MPIVELEWESEEEAIREEVLVEWEVEEVRYFTHSATLNLAVYGDGEGGRRENRDLYASKSASVVGIDLVGVFSMDEAEVWDEDEDEVDIELDGEEREAEKEDKRVYIDVTNKVVSNCVVDVKFISF